MPTIAGHPHLIAGERDGEAEVKGLAVREDRQGQGVGRMLVEHAAAACRGEGRATLLVATAAAGTAVLRFSQRSGFRMLRVERDAFTPATGYPPIEIDGIQLPDRVWLSLTLS